MRDWYIITLEGQREGGFRQAPRTLADGLTHAGGVVFRKVKDQVEYLLVQANNTPEEWVLPKGHVEPGEAPRETAVREVYEETGVWARVLSELDTVSFSVAGKPIKVQYYQMEALNEGEPIDVEREHKWQSFNDALKSASHPQSQELLRLADQTDTAP